MRTLLSTLIGVSSLLAASAAGCSHVIDASDFDQRCAADTDCVAVLVGDMCDCACTLGAISKSAFPAYQEADSGRSCSKQCEPCLPEGTAFCSAGKCAIH